MYSKFKFRKFLIALMSMLMAVMLAFSVACNGSSSNDDEDSSDDSSTTTTYTDYQTIKNGDFEFGTEKVTNFPYSSSINWSRNLESNVTTAPSSTATSGIIDTKAEVFDKMESKNKPSVNPGTPNSKGLLTEDEQKAYDYEDKEKRVNANVTGTKILMINNKKNGEGTAQYYRATSTISVAANKYVLLSFWMKTFELKSMYNDTPGAYVKLNGSSFDDFRIDGINTNGEWVKFEFAIAGSELNSTTLNLTFGVGKGNGTDHNEFVEGYAFYDNVNVKTIERVDYDGYVADKEISSINFANESVELPSQYLDNEADETPLDNFTFIKTKLSFDNEPTLTNIVNEGIEFKTGDYDYTHGGLNKIGYGSIDEVKANAPERVKNALSDAFSNYVYFDFVNESSASYTTGEYSIEGTSFDYITFYARVKAGNINSDSLKVEVLDNNNENDTFDGALFTNIETSKVEESRYGDYVRYQIFINNPTDIATKYQLKFTFGNDGEWKDAFALQTGYAIIADIQIAAKVDEDMYSSATTNNYIAKKQIYGEYLSYEDSVDDTASDNYSITIDKSQTFTIKEAPAKNISGYAYRSTKEDTIYGIINSKYYDEENNKYGSSTSFTSKLEGFSDLKVTTNSYAQLLVLDNKTAGYSRYVSPIKTITKNTINQVIVKVKAYGSAVAQVSLVSTNIDDKMNYEVKELKADDFTASLTSTVTKDSYTKGGWTYVYFYVEAGDEDFEYRVEISNGTKDIESQGVIVTEGYTATTVTSSTVSAHKAAMELNFKALGDSYNFDRKEHTRAPATVQKTDENHETIETTRYFEPTEVYFGNPYAKFVSFSTTMVEEIIDETGDHSDHDHETEDNSDDEYVVNPNAALQISSIVIALVLIGVIITILVRNALKKRQRRKETTAMYYEETSGFNRDTREKALKKIAEKKAKIELASDDEEYDYDAAEQIEEVEVIEEAQEESTEEVEVQEEVTEAEETAEEVATETEETAESSNEENN